MAGFVEFEDKKKEHEVKEVERATEISLLKQQLEELDVKQKLKEAEDEQEKEQLKGNLKGAQDDIVQVKVRECKLAMRSQWPG